MTNEKIEKITAELEKRFLTSKIIVLPNGKIHMENINYNKDAIRILMIVSNSLEFDFTIHGQLSKNGGVLVRIF